MNFYKPVHFKLEELVPENIFAARGAKSLELLDPRMLYTIDCLREFFNVPLTINDWLWNGKNHYRGFRPQGSAVGAALSMHRLARAYDIVSPKMTAEEMRLKILECNKLFPYIRRMEADVTWLHIDNANINHDGIYLFKP